MATFRSSSPHLQACRSSSTVQVRLLCFWEARNVRCAGELMGVDRLILDSQVSYLHPPFVHEHSLSPVSSLGISTVLKLYSKSDFFK
ncbi:hypothetical protein Bca52824_085741 [Brassica carinata]|uniref:Uncharacterized protein n=2 Tax=Brassica TaxID=3705 RepID=A0A8X7P8P9_BRACI|nr:hypothetical protein Bca52824_085741 [Brassica carinata]